MTSRPLYGGGSGVCVYSVYVYIVFALWVSSGCLWSTFCRPWVDFGHPFGSLWGALGSRGALLNVTLASLWLPLAPLGRRWTIWGTLGSQVELGLTLHPAHKDLVELSAASGASGATGKSAQSGARAAAPNPTSLAPGARMTVVKHTPSSYDY